VENILLIHSAIIDETGGSHGVRDHERLLGIVAHPKQIVFGKEIRPTLFDKAASYGFDIIKYHPFTDGNKRSGMLCMGAFLELNNFKIDVKTGMIEKMAVDIVVKNLEIHDIAKWLKKWSKRKK